MLNSTTQTQIKPVPAVPSEYWLVKNLPRFGKNPLKFLIENRNKYGDFYETNLSPFVSVFVLSKPDYVKHVLVDNNKNYVKSFAYTFLKQSLGNGLLTSEGDFWRKQRRIAQPAFHKERLTSIASTMVQSTAGMLEQWKIHQASKQPFDMAQEMMKLTSEIAAKALFSSDIRDILDTIVQSVTVINQYVTNKVNSPFRSPLWIPTKGNLLFKKTQKKLDKIIYGIIENRRNSGKKYNDLLEMLMETQDEETGERMSDLQLRDEVMTLFIAGSETSSNALAWSLYLLAKHPEEKHILGQEIKRVLDNQLPAFVHLPQLSYTTQVIQEAMRLYPPAWVIGRMAVEDDIIDGYVIPKGSQVYMCTYIMHRHPDLWNSPDVFDPERFSPEKYKQRHKFAYFPFSGGPRLCIGNNFAMMEMAIALAMITQRYNLELATTQPIELDQLITLRPKNGIWMKIGL